MNKKTNYVPVGPLTDDNIYIERDADYEIVNLIKKMEYITVIEPRQQGKTSLVRRLIRSSSLAEWRFVYADISTLDLSSEAGWYRTLCKRILNDLQTLPGKKNIRISQSNIEWRDFLYEIAGRAFQAGIKLIIILDEIGAAKFENNSLFFSSLREIYTTRQVQIDCDLKNLSFILVGSYNPHELIHDSNQSPFNISQRVSLADFSLEQTHLLLIKKGWAKDRAEILAERIYHWVSGHPYLTQYLCGHLEINSAKEDVDSAVDQLIRNETHNLSHIVKAIDGRDDLRSYLVRILKKEKIPYAPNHDPMHETLGLIGLVCSDSNGQCVIRNRVYEILVSDITMDRRSVKEHFKEKQPILIKVLAKIFVAFPRVLGRAVLDFFNREKASDSTAVFGGYLILVVIALILLNLLDLDILIGIWRFFVPAQ
jgi:hypothetical protein